MKTSRLLVALLLLWWGTTISQAQSFSVDWFTIDGGGGTSMGGVYSVSGTVGQPDAGGAMTGESYSVTGGFWSLFAVQTSGAPLLKIFGTATNIVVVSWSSSSLGWNLQQITNFSTTNWFAPSESVNDDTTNKFIIVNPPVGNRFYRLFKP
jgi:hypothetical protein